MNKQVTNEEYVKMFGDLNTPQNKLTNEQRDNHLTMRKVTNQYRKTLTEEEIRACMMEATWRCLRHHEEDKGNKFTTSLWRFIKWECQRLCIKKIKSQNNNTVSINDFKTFDFVMSSDTEEVKNIRECIELLPDNYRELIQEYYFDKYTMAEIGERHSYTKAAAGQKINRAIQKLKEIYTSRL